MNTYGSGLIPEIQLIKNEKCNVENKENTNATDSYNRFPVPRSSLVELFSNLHPMLNGEVEVQGMQSKRHNVAILFFYRIHWIRHTGVERDRSAKSQPA